MSIYHIIIDKGEDYPHDGEDRHDHIVTGKGDDTLEYVVDHDAHYDSKESLETDLAFLREIKANLIGDGILMPERLAREIENLTEHVQEWEPPPPPRPKETCLRYQMYQQKAEPGQSIQQVLDQTVPGGRGISTLREAWNVNDQTRWYNGPTVVDADYIFQEEDQIEGFIRIAEKGTSA